MRALLVLALLALPLLPPPAAALSPSVSDCGLALGAPPATTDACVRVDLATAAGASHAQANATSHCVGRDHHASHGFDSRSPLGNPGLSSGNGGSTLRTPYVCEL